MKDVIKGKIAQALTPSFLEIINESDKHHNHPGSPNTGQSHYRLKIVSSTFEGMSRLKRHKLVYDILSEEMKKIHALALTTKTPEEAST